MAVSQSPARPQRSPVLRVWPGVPDPAQPDLERGWGEGTQKRRTAMDIARPPALGHQRMPRRPQSGNVLPMAAAAAGIGEGSAS